MTATVINLFDFIPASEHAAIAAQTSTHPCDTDLSAAISALPVSGGKIEFGAGKFCLADTINLKNTVILEGVGSGQAGTDATLLSFAPDRHGVIINRTNTLGDGVQSPPTTGGDASILRNLTLRSQGGTVGHGVWMRGRGEVANICVKDFPGNGINIVAENGGNYPELMGNANNWKVERVLIHTCHHGIYVRGSDANAGIAIAVDVTHNRGWGIWDYSFLGNSYIGCHAAGNIAGPYKSDGQSAANSFIDCYSEGGQPPSSLMHPAMVWNGLHGAGIVGSAMVLGGSVLTPFTSRQSVPKFPADGTMRQIGTRVAAPGGSFLDMAADGADFAFGWGLVWDEQSKTIRLMYERRVWEGAFELTTEATAGGNYVKEDMTPLGRGKMLMPGSWVRGDSGRYHFVDLNALEKRIAALEAQP